MDNRKNGDFVFTTHADEIFIEAVSDRPAHIARSVYLYRPLMKNLMARGWSLEYHDSNRYFTITLTRPAIEKPVSTHDVETKWAEFMNSTDVLKNFDENKWANESMF